LTVFVFNDTGKSARETPITDIQSLMIDIMAFPRVWYFFCSSFSRKQLINVEPKKKEG
jgi:hypothetical protein